MYEAVARFRLAQFASTAVLVLFGSLLGTEHASALTLEEARERCRESIGKPTVQACMKSGVGANLEDCRAKATPRVRACIEKAMSAAHGRANVPLALPTEKKAAPSQLNSLPAGFIAPPRTISDITAILDGEKPDAAQIEKRRAAADAAVPGNIEKSELAWFYYTRGNARAQLGRLNEAIDDANKAMETGRGVVDANRMGRFQQFAGLQYSFAGNPRKALAIFEAQARDTNAQGARGFRISGHRNIAGLLIQMGDIPQADAYLRRSLTLIQEARTSGMPGWRESYALLGQSWEAELEAHRAILFEARGQFRDAEAAYLVAEQRTRASVKGVTSQKNAPPEAQLLQAADNMVLSQARMKARQGRLAEAEADARRALLARLQDQGKYHPLTSRYVSGLAEILVEQGRYEEAERLVRAAFDISRTVGVAEDSQAVAQQLLALGSILTLQQKSAEAAAVYADLDKAIAKWDPQRRQAIDLSTSRITSLYASGQVEAGLLAAQELLKRESTLLGEKHFSTAAARGTLAVGYMRAGRHADAVREFKAAIPVLMAAARENADDDNTTAVVARSARLQSIVESYISLLAQRQAGGADDVAAETFHLADAIRGQSVQQALSASSARMSVKDPALAGLIRKEQDLSKQVNAQLGTLNNALALPASERDDGVIKALNASIEAVRIDRDKARTDIRRGFPAYADLIEPRSPGVDDVRGALRDDEALLSFYFGQQNSFVWVVPKNGPVAFATVAATVRDLEGKVRRVREPLEAPGETIADILPFDLKLAHELYGMLLKPVETGWKSAKSLIVVTNGALGLLPLSLLPTAPSEVNETADLPFEGYRKVPWLMRSHAVTMVPSVAALRTLRRLPQASDKREPLIGFGDPYFSVEQAAEAEKAAQPLQVAAASRGIPLRRRAIVKTRQVDSADLALLPRLPDTAEELTSIALSLQTDPAKVLHLGKAANDRRVMDTDLTRFRIIAFATHGLVPGDLNGLTQPALALSAPSVADVDGDGLLTMEEVLALKLDSDWVVLSACNTATGAGAGAEAVSGLGRAFFYAGTRTLLVTNWAVHSVSARDLVTDIFRRHALDGKLSRAEALRQAMVALMDGPGYAESGKTLFTYGHPMFWAPYTIIGDGGG